MKVLFVSSGSGSRGGGELYLLFLAQALTKHGVQTALWCPDHPRMDELATAFAKIGAVARSPYVNTFDRPLRSLPYLLPCRRGRRMAQRQWSAFQPDVLHLNKQLLEDGLDLMQWVDDTGIPSLCTIHITQPAAELGSMLGGWRDFVALRRLRRYRGPLVSVGAARGKGLRNLLGSQARIEILNNGVELPNPDRCSSLRHKTRQGLNISNKTLLVLGVGRMEAQKDPARFLDWAKHLHQRERNTRFLWVGDGRMTSAWDDRVKHLGLEHCVQRLPWQSSVDHWYAAADLLLHPAVFEGLPFALLEAMAWSLPVVVTSRLAAELDFLDRSSALIEGTDTDWAAGALNTTIRTAVGKAGRQLVESHFSRQAMADHYIRLYRQLIRNK